MFSHAVPCTVKWNQILYVYTPPRVLEISLHVKQDVHIRQSCEQDALHEMNDSVHDTGGNIQNTIIVVHSKLLI